MLDGAMNHPRVTFLDGLTGSVAGRRDPGRNAPGRVDGQTGPATGSEGAGGAVDQAAGTGRAGGRLGGQPEGDEHPTHGVGLRHRAQDPARAPAALTDQHLDREHPGGAARAPVHRPEDRAPVAARASSGELGSPAGLGSRYIPHSPAAMMPRPAPRRCATDRAPHARGSRLPPRPRPGRGASLGSRSPGDGVAGPPGSTPRRRRTTPCSCGQVA
jgi:hypothetical protein